MSIALSALLGLFAATLVNRAADCWLGPAPLACGLTRHPRRQATVIAGVPLLFVLVGGRAGDAAGAPIAGAFAAVFVLLAIIDWEQRRLPNVILLPALAVAVVVSRDPLAATAAAAIAFLVFLALHVLGRRLYGPGALDMGDVKLAALVAAVVGPAAAGAALLLGVVLAGGGAVVWLLSGRGRGDSVLPYGAFLAAAGVVALLWPQ